MTDPREQLVEDLQAIREHDFDAATMFCRRCGSGLADLIDRDQRHCAGGGKVVGISHHIAARRLRALCAGIFDA